MALQGRKKGFTSSVWKECDVSRDLKRGDGMMGTSFTEGRDHYYLLKLNASVRVTATWCEDGHNFKSTMTTMFKGAQSPVFSAWSFLFSLAFGAHHM